MYAVNTASTRRLKRTWPRAAPALAVTADRP